jgi:hypothetical protein
LLVEIRSLYSDRTIHDKEQANARAEQLAGFDNISKNQLDGFQKIADGINKSIDKSDKNFTDTSTQNLNQFKATMKELTAVTNKQLVLSQAQQEMIDSANGHLEPGDAPMPIMTGLNCGAPLNEGEYLIAIGRYV